MSSVLSAGQIIDLEQVSASCFRNRYSLDNMTGSTFGGQLLALGLRAAQRSGVDWPVHNCSGYFLSRTSLTDPIEFEVETTRSGRRFATRRVIARQNGAPAFDMLCSFHAGEEGLSHQTDSLAGSPAPEDVPTIAEYVTRHADRIPAAAVELYTRDFPVELRLINPEPYFFGEGDHSIFSFWFRVPSAEDLPDAQSHACLFALLSDWWLGVTPLLPHYASTIAKQNVGLATLNHSVWFHAPARVDQWLLCRASSPWTGNGRGVVTAVILDREGTQAATVTQEVVMPALRG